MNRFIKSQKWPSLGNRLNSRVFWVFQLVEETQRVMNTMALRDQNDQEERKRQEAIIQKKRQMRQEKIRRESNNGAAPTPRGKSARKYKSDNSEA